MQVYVAACLGLEGGVGNIVNRYLEKIYKKKETISAKILTMEAKLNTLEKMESSKKRAQKYQIS